MKDVGVFFLDVDTKDETVGMSCPPFEFVEIGYLRKIHESLCEDGRLIINVSARDKECLTTLCSNVNSVFNCVYISESFEEEVNVVVVGFKVAPVIGEKLELMERVEGEEMKEAVCLFSKWKKKSRGGKKKKKK